MAELSITCPPAASTSTVSGSLTNEPDIDSINTVTGSLTLAGSNGITISDDTVDSDNPILTIVGGGAGGSGVVSNALVGTDGITVLSGTPTLSETTISGFRTEFINASGTLSAEIASDIATHSAISSAHHSRYTDAEAISALEPTTSALAASGVVTGANIVSVSGHLQSEIDAVEGSDVDDVNSVTGSVIIAGAGEVAVTTAGQTITISGTPHVTPAPPDAPDIDSINTVTGTLTLNGADGITIVDDTINSDTPVLTISGFETIFVSASGSLQNQIDQNVSNIVDNTTLITTTSGHLQDQISMVGGKTLTIESPTPSENIFWFYIDQSVTVSSLIPVVTGTLDPGITWTAKFGPTRAATGTEIITGGTNTHLGNTDTVITTFDNATISANSFVRLETTSASGTITELGVTMLV